MNTSLAITSLTINTSSKPTEAEIACPFTEEQNYATVSTNNSSNGQANTLIAKASLYGIDTDKYVTYDSSTGKTTININGLQVAIESAQKTTLMQSTEEDSFERTTSTDEELQTEASYQKEDVDSYITSSSDYYQKVIDSELYSSEEEKVLLEEWSAIISQANDLTSVTTSNATVANGYREFIDSYKKLEEKTNNFLFAQNTDNEDPVSDTTYKNIFIYSNEDSNEDLLGDNPFFNSAFETSEYEEDEVTA